MKRLVKITCLAVYIFFTQISPYFHWHVHEHHGEIEFNISIHPPDFPVDDHTHDDHEEASGEHQHQDIHLNADWKYILQGKTPNLIHSEEIFTIIDISDNPKVFILTPLDIPLKVPRLYLAALLPDRAPPRLT